MRHRKFACVLLLFAGRLPSSAQTPAIPGVLTLETAEQLLIQRSQALAGSRYQLEVSQALRQIAGYKPNPIVHVAAEQVPFWSPIPGSYPRFFESSPNAASNPVYTGMLTKVIERGGKRELRSEQADAVVDVSRAQIADTFRTQLFQLRQAFTTAILARENLNLAQTIDAQYGQTERLTNVRLAAGDVPEVELMRVRAARLPYRQAVLDSQTAYQQAVRDILNLLNLRPQETAPAVTPIATVPGVIAPLQIEGGFRTTPVVTTLEELRRLALSERPDIVAARAAVRAGERGTALALAQRKRDVAVGVEYQRVGNDHSAGVIAEFPLFVYNNQKALALQAVAQQRTAEAQLRLLETQAATDVEKAWQAYVAAQRSLAIYGDEGLANTERVRSVLQFSYEKGEASLFELLDAQRTASQSAVAANQARAAYTLAVWQLEQAIGRPLP